MRYLIAVILFAVVTSAGVANAAITVDGNMADWKLSTINSNTSLLTPDMSTPNGYPEWSDPGDITGGVTNQLTLGDGTIIHYNVEDNNDDGPVGPEFGGQNYDAEYLGVVVSGGKLYIGLSTGQRPDNESGEFAPGDFRLEIRDGSVLQAVYGIEVGNSDGNKGATFALTSSGYTDLNKDDGVYTDGVDVHETGQTAGSVWKTSPAFPDTWDNEELGDTNWYHETVGGWPYLMTQLIGGERVGDADSYEYNVDINLGQHAFIELSVDLGLFAPDTPYSNPTMDISWHPSCGNDESTLSVEDIDFAPPVPEPASIVVWGLLIISMSTITRRRRKS